MNEFELIALLTKNTPREAMSLVCGVGDDCAVIKKNEEYDYLVTIDALIENIHFCGEWTDLKTLGRKSLSVNLSDIAAMGGSPRFYLVSIGLPKTDSAKIAKQVYEGMNEISREYSVIMIGGDTVLSPLGLVISITAIGEVKHNNCLYRSGAKAGDVIYVTGTLGGSALGLSCLQKRCRKKESEEFIRRHLDPTPKLSVGEFIASTQIVTSMIDISDGLLLDLSHIADESKTGFEINLSDVPVEEGFASLSKSLLLDPTKISMTGGEDYELLFTVKKSEVNKFEDSFKSSGLSCKISRIGEIISDRNKRIIRDNTGNDVKFGNLGFDHFA